MSSLPRRMKRNSGQLGTTKPGKFVGLRNLNCQCCIAKKLRDEARAVRNQKGHVL